MNGDEDPVNKRIYRALLDIAGILFGILLVISVSNVIIVYILMTIFR